MIEKEFYLTIQQPGVAEFKDRGSRFIAYAYPVESVDVFKNYLQQSFSLTNMDLNIFQKKVAAL